MNAWFEPADESVLEPDPSNASRRVSLTQESHVLVC